MPIDDTGGTLVLKLPKRRPRKKFVSRKINPDLVIEEGNVVHVSGIVFLNTEKLIDYRDLTLLSLQNFQESPEPLNREELQNFIDTQEYYDAVSYELDCRVNEGLVTEEELKFDFAKKPSYDPCGSYWCDGDPSDWFDGNDPSWFN